MEPHASFGICRDGSRRTRDAVAEAYNGEAGTFEAVEEAACVEKRIGRIYFEANKDTLITTLGVLPCHKPTVIAPGWFQKHSAKKFNKLLGRVDELTAELSVEGELIKAFFAAEREV